MDEVDREQTGNATQTQRNRSAHWLIRGPSPTGDGENLMQRDEVIRTLAEHRTQLRAMGVKSLALFGSVARGDDRPDSYIDLLVEFQGRATFDQYTDLKFLLEDLLGRRVDLVSSRGLRPQVRSFVERDMLYVA